MLREAEETLALNKRISSNAIQKALLDAANGDSVSALNTLQKAISLIQQGKFGTDPRNAVIIESLQVYCLSYCFVVVLIKLTFELSSSQEVLTGMSVRWEDLNGNGKRRSTRDESKRSRSRSRSSSHSRTKHRSTHSRSRSRSHSRDSKE